MKMATLSAMRLISFMRWETYMMILPSSRSLRMILKRHSISASEREAVGSSKQMTFRFSRL